MRKVLIRPAALADAPALCSIYEYYVNHTAVSFEYVPPTPEEFQDRMAHTMERYPYLVAQGEGKLLGYACAGPFHPRAAYGWCAELTVYLDPDARGQGVGRQLYAALEDALKEMGVLNLYACIADTDREDEYLPHDSPRFHARLGFTEVGRFQSCGYKFGRWYDMIWMEKIVGDHGDSPAPVAPWPELR